MRYRRLRIDGGAYFFTVATHRRRPIFADDAACDLLLADIELVRARHPFEQEAFVLMPDHLHVLWQLPAGDSNFPMRWMLIKSRFRRNYAKRFGTDGQSVWQNRYWEHWVDNERSYFDLVEYIHANPVRHGLARRPIDWLHSSFHAYVRRGDYSADWTMERQPSEANRWGE